jgi:MFS family permease
VLIVARGVQGLGAALVSPAALSILTTTFAEGEERTEAMGVWGAIAGAGGAFGLLIGGVLTDVFSWPWIFLVNIPIGIGTALAALRYVPESRGTMTHRRFDLAGAVSVTAGLLVLVYAIVRAEVKGWGSLHTLGLTAVALALLATFVVVERPLGGAARPPRPSARAHAGHRQRRALRGRRRPVRHVLLRLSVCAADPRVLAAEGGPRLPAGDLRDHRRRHARVDGAHTPSRRPPTVVGGMSLAAAGLVVLAVTTKVDGSYLGILFGLVPMSVGMGCTFVPLTLVATTGVDTEDAGLASGLFNTFQQIGGALGLAVLSTLATDRTTSFLNGLGHAPSAHDQAAGLVEGFQLAFQVSAGLMVVGVILVAVLLRRRDLARIDTTQPVMAGA